MLKLFLSIIVITLSTFAVNLKAQSRIGYSESDIRHKEFPEKEFISGTFNNGEKWISWNAETVICTYVFDSTNICSWCAIQPKNQGALNYYVEQYNKNYVIIYDTHWKWYSDKGIIKITLSFPKDAEGYSTFYFDQIK